MITTFTIHNKTYSVVKFLGHGKGGYSYLTKHNGTPYVVKKIHHEPCNYYTFGNKIESENNDYQKLLATGIRIPQMFDIDLEQELIVKEYIEGPSIYDLVADGNMKDIYINQMRDMAKQVYAHGLNIDYFPTNLIVQNDLLYYIDYECNPYMDEWNFENWGIKYWSKTSEFSEYLVGSLFEELSKIPQVEAIALGGSRATGKNDETSDYDTYIYLTGPVNEEIRKTILEKYCKYMEIGNSFWELEDDVTLKDGIDMDIIYRNMKDFEKTISSVVDDYTSYNGYTTCMWHNLITSKIIYDKNGNLKNLQNKYNIPYPQGLKENIISNNLKLLHGMLPSFDTQIEKAELRKDFVSVNHRVTEFLASYFDIIFALNEKTHPGEKRMQSICSEECHILPENFDNNLNRLFENMFRENVTPIITDMIRELTKKSLLN